MSNHTKRVCIQIGALVDIVQKPHQQTGELTRGKVKRLLTSKANHPRGIKVMLDNDIVGRVQHIVGDSSARTLPSNTVSHEDDPMGEDWHI